MEKLKYFAGGKFIESKTDKYNEVVNPSTGEVTALVPCCKMCIRDSHSSVFRQCSWLV